MSESVKKKRGGGGLVVLAVQSVQLMLVLIKFNSPFAVFLCFFASQWSNRQRRQQKSLKDNLPAGSSFVFSLER